jgi:hypothetical protein
MATRANVLIKSVGLDFTEPSILLYHHYDGYPRYMLPTMLRYEEIFEKEVREKFQVSPEGERWRLGRVGYLASLIIATDPLGFEVSRVFEEGEEIIIHPDIDFYYVLTAYNQRGRIGSDPQLWIDGYTSLGLKEKLQDKFWETGDPQYLKKLFHVRFIENVIQKILRKY